MHQPCKLAALALLHRVLLHLAPVLALLPLAPALLLLKLPQALLLTLPQALLLTLPQALLLIHLYITRFLALFATSEKRQAVAVVRRENVPSLAFGVQGPPDLAFLRGICGNAGHLSSWKLPVNCLRTSAFSWTDGRTSRVPKPRSLVVPRASPAAALAGGGSARPRPPPEAPHALGIACVEPRSPVVPRASPAAALAGGGSAPPRTPPKLLIRCALHVSSRAAP